MKYLLIDTNIYLDMLIDRKNRVSSDLVESFEKLLDFNEITLIVPSIIKYETYKHIDDEFDKVSLNLKKTIENIKQLYGVNAYKVNDLDINEFKRKSEKELQDATTMFEANKDSYRQDLKRLIEKLFTHRNTIIINEDDKLVKACFLRHMYKKAPFHIEGKESTADGMITEILINICNYITIDNDSEIYFVTGNYTDFSEKGNKNILNKHITQDLLCNGLDKKVSYIRTFNELIGKSLAQEVANAKLNEEFEREMEAEEETLRELHEMEYKDIYRESNGLSPLSSFESNIEDGFVDSEFYEKIHTVFKRINKTYSGIEDFKFFYEEVLLDFFVTLNLANIESAMKEMNNFFSKFGEPIVDLSFQGICDTKEWILNKIKELKESEFDEILIDNLDFGNKIAILNVNRQKSYLILDKMYLSPDEEGQDDIDICIKSDTENIIAIGYIRVTYGYMEEDDDGGIGDGCSEGIDYYTLEIEKEMEQIASELEREMAKNEEMICELTLRLQL